MSFIGSAHGADFLTGDLRSRPEPIFEVLSMFPAALLVELVGTAADSLLEVLSRPGGHLLLHNRFFCHRNRSFRRSGEPRRGVLAHLCASVTIIDNSAILMSVPFQFPDLRAFK